MPYFLVDGKSIYDQLHAPKFHLLVFTDSEHGVRDLQQELEHEFVDSILQGRGFANEFKVIILTPRIAEIFGMDRPFYLLLRPDNYIGFISTEIFFADLETYIHEVLGHDRSTTISNNLLLKFVGKASFKKLS